MALSDQMFRSVQISCRRLKRQNVCMCVIECMDVLVDFHFHLNFPALQVTEKPALIVCVCIFTVNFTKKIIEFSLLRSNCSEFIWRQRALAKMDERKNESWHFVMVISIEMNFDYLTECVYVCVFVCFDRMHEFHFQFQSVQTEYQFILLFFSF